jgi:glutaredoxin
VTALTIYTRPGCHLCDEMKATINRVSRSSHLPLVIEEVDISSDPELETRYGQEIPVLLIEGRKAAKYRVTEEELARILESRG